MVLLSDLITVIEESRVVSVTTSDSNVIIAPTGSVVSVSPAPKQVKLAATENIVSVSAPGPPGPKGGTGPAAGAAIEYVQVTPASSWPITHNLNRLVGVVLALVTGEVVYSQIDQSDPNVAVIIFPTPTAGKALVI